MKKFVKDLKEKDQIQAVYLVSEKQVLTDKNGKSYLNVNLNDVSGGINARMWDKVDEVHNLFQNGEFIEVKGHVQVFQNRRQVVIHDIKKAREGSYQLSDFLAAAERPADEMLKDILSYVTEIQDPALKQLIQQTLEDPEMIPLLKVCPAAKSIHHAYVGGMLEHVLSICGIMKFLSGHYNFLNYDWLIFGAIFHDIGKVWELQVGNGISYTDTGRLVGHMALACEWVDKKAVGIDGFTDEKRDLCRHIILSHHGKLEYGSPKRPQFLEAMVVAMIDELDSQINSLLGFMKRELEGDQSWTRYHTGFDRYFYLNILKQRLDAVDS